jgi:integrase
MSFAEAAAGYVEDNRASWRSKVHLKQWNTTLRDYVFPVLGSLPVSAIETGHITKILRPIWLTKSSTAIKVRGRIEAILDWSAAHGFREGENPARWAGHLDHILPKREKIAAAKVEHHEALLYSEMPAFFAKLMKAEGISARALETLILTTVRVGKELLHAKWDEFDFAQAVWTVPGERTKNGNDLRVPLAPYMVTRLQGLPRDPSGLLFPVGQSSLRRLLHRIIPNGAAPTLHGFRASFRTWCREQIKDIPDVFAEQALGHTVDSKLVQAYQRSDGLDPSRVLAEKWTIFCLSAR